ncbi:MAG: hypothetical protein JWO41_350 [Candidatus Saccharibacteria bacterium]|nr:hypothetical protein [Candidatus Saccharibacteria bacterium]
MTAPGNGNHNLDPNLLAQVGQTINLLEQARQADETGLGLLVAAGSQFATAENNRNQVGTAVQAAQGFAARVSVPSGILAPAAVQPGQVNAPAPAPQQTTVTTAQNRSTNFWPAAIVAFVLTFVVAAIVWAIGANIAGGHGGWAHDGSYQLLFALVLAGGVAWLVANRVRDGRPPVNITVRAAAPAAPAAPAPQPQQPAPGNQP